MAAIIALSWTVFWSLQQAVPLSTLPTISSGCFPQQQVLSCMCQHFSWLPQTKHREPLSIHRCFRVGAADPGFFFLAACTLLSHWKQEGGPAELQKALVWCCHVASRRRAVSCKTLDLKVAVCHNEKPEGGIRKSFMWQRQWIHTHTFKSQGWQHSNTLREQLV